MQSNKPIRSNIKYSRKKIIMKIWFEFFSQRFFRIFKFWSFFAENKTNLLNLGHFSINVPSEPMTHRFCFVMAWVMVVRERGKTRLMANLSFRKFYFINSGRTSKIFWTHENFSRIHRDHFVSNQGFKILRI